VASEDYESFDLFKNNVVVLSGSTMASLTGKAGPSYDALKKFPVDEIMDTLK